MRKSTAKTTYRKKIGPVVRLVLFGGGPLIVEFARAAAQYEIDVCVFAARRHLEETIDSDRNLTLKDVLENEDIPFFRVNHIEDSAELASVVAVRTLGIGLGETYTFTEEIIDLFDGNLFDFMTIRLPQYRGGAHFTWQILRQDRVGCWNIQVINADMIPGIYDSGEIIKTREYVIPPSARLPADYFELAFKEGLKLFHEFMSDVQAEKEFERVQLPERSSSYFPRLSTLKQGFINWAWQADELERFICAFDEPYPGASTFLNGERVFLKDCRAEYSEGRSHPFMSGLIYRIRDGLVYVAAKDAALVLGKITNTAGIEINADLTVGHRFYTPLKYLEEAALFRAEYDADGLVTEK